MRLSIFLGFILATVLVVDTGADVVRDGSVGPGTGV